MEEKKNWKEKRSRVSISLSSEEKKELHRQADYYQMNHTKALKYTAFSAFRKTKMLPEDYRRREITGINLIRNVGSNVNQMTHHANFSGRLQLKSALRRIDELERVVRSYFKNLPTQE